MDGKYTEHKNILSYQLRHKGSNSGLLELELTQRCNNACIHCCVNLPETSPEARNELKFEEWLSILKQAAELGVLTVRFNGGEPMLRPDFLDIYLAARKLGITVSIFTNARCITPELAKVFTKIPPLKEIEVTVYGMQAGTYEAVSCSPGSYNEFKRGVDLLLENQIPFVVKGSFLPQNKSDISELNSWAKSIPWMDGHLPIYSMFFDLRLNRDSSVRNQFIRQLRVTSEEEIQQYFDERPEFLSEMDNFCNRYLGTSSDWLFSCGGKFAGTVDAYGWLHHCTLLRDRKLAYNLRTGTLAEAIKNHFPRVWEMKPTNNSYIERCLKCFIRELCEQCPARSYMENGNLDTPVEYFCNIAHIQARYLGLLSAGEKAWEVTDAPERVKQMNMKG